jgi:hypothetical protein
MGSMKWVYVQEVCNVDMASFAYAGYWTANLLVAVSYQTSPGADVLPILCFVFSGFGFLTYLLSFHMLETNLPASAICVNPQEFLTLSFIENDESA